MSYSRKGCKRESSHTTARPYQKIGRFCKVHYWAERTNSKPVRNREKFQQKIVDVMGRLSRLWKRIEDIKNAPNDTVPVLAEDHIKLTEQAVLRLGQASNSVLNIKNLTKGHKDIYIYIYIYIYIFGYIYIYIYIYIYLGIYI